MTNFMPPTDASKCPTCNNTWTKAERIEGAPVDSQYIGDLTLHSWCDCLEKIFKNNGGSYTNAREVHLKVIE